MPKLNNTNGNMQHVDAANAPRIPPVAIQRAFLDSARSFGKVEWVCSFITVIIGPVVTTDSRFFYDKFDKTFVY